MIKWFAIILLIALSFISKAGQKFTEQIAISKTGADIVRIRSYVNYTAYCKIYNEDGTYFVDWYLLAGSVSRWYHVPDGDWSWTCS